MHDIEKAQMDKMVEQRVTFLAPLTDWTVLVVFTPKKYNEQRLFEDNVRLNSNAVRDSYPILRTNECIDTLGDAKVFSAQDSNTGYGQTLITLKDHDKTTFKMNLGTYAFTPLLFGVKNVPATYQRAIDTILTTVR